MRVVLLLVLLGGFANAASAEGPLTATLQARRVVDSASGEQTTVPAEAASPGDILEYRTTYRNHSNGVLRGVVATLPVPVDCEFVGAATQGALASLDGKTWGAIPLTRKVRGSDGREQVQTVPASEYRFLRWTLGNLPAKASQTVTARMRVTAAPNSNTSR